MGRGRFVLVALAIVAALAGVWSGTSSAAPASQGCAELNSGAADGTYGSTERAVRSFVAGDVVTVTAVAAPGVLTPGSLYMTKRIAVDGSFIEDTVEVDSSGFPGVLTYTIPADAVYRLGWGADVGGASFQASCTPADPAATSTTTTTATTTTTTTDGGPDDSATTSTTTVVGVIGDSGTTSTPPVTDATRTETVAAAAAAATATPSFTG